MGMTLAQLGQFLFMLFPNGRQIWGERQSDFGRYLEVNSKGEIQIFFRDRVRYARIKPNGPAALVPGGPSTGPPYAAAAGAPVNSTSAHTAAGRSVATPAGKAAPAPAAKPRKQNKKKKPQTAKRASNPFALLPSQ
jgi:hypothetical protein